MVSSSELRYEHTGSLATYKNSIYIYDMWDSGRRFHGQLTRIGGGQQCLRQQERQQQQDGRQQPNGSASVVHLWSAETILSRELAQPVAYL
ncbi:GD24540 [Drosophila simulans]|uniref:GD24540 n=1 Tax=Drosophila simulans TaxID=7240 RepID=B4NUA3_DROSI|nr:GD24540 [Drosophila simulans]